MGQDKNSLPITRVDGVGQKAGEGEGLGGDEGGETAAGQTNK